MTTGLISFTNYRPKHSWLSPFWLVAVLTILRTYACIAKAYSTPMGRFGVFWYPERWFLSSKPSKGTSLGSRFLCTDFHKNWHGCRDRRSNHSVQFWSQYVQQFQIYRGSKFPFSHWLCLVIVTTVLPLPRSIWCIAHCVQWPLAMWVWDIHWIDSSSPGTGLYWLGMHSITILSSSLLKNVNEHSWCSGWDDLADWLTCHCTMVQDPCASHIKHPWAWSLNNWQAGPIDPMILHCWSVNRKGTWPVESPAVKFEKVHVLAPGLTWVTPASLLKIESSSSSSNRILYMFCYLFCTRSCY